MHCSCSVLPTSPNPASFIPVVIDYYLFENYSSMPVYESDEGRRCPTCSRLYDGFSTCNGSLITCLWCQKQNKITENVQIQGSPFIIRKEIDKPYDQALFFVLDACSGSKHFNDSKNYLIHALGSIPEDRKFYLAIIKNSFMTVAFVTDDCLTTFDIPYKLPIYEHLDVSRPANTAKDLPVLTKFINSLVPELAGTKNVDDFAKQFSKSTNFFGRIVLFSTKGPNKRYTENVFVDWISPISQKTKPDIGGYFLNLVPFVGNHKNQQISALMSKVTNADPIYNVSMQAYIDNYNVSVNKFRYSTALDSFHQTFNLYPTPLINTIVEVHFGIETNFIRFSNGKIYQETVCVFTNFYRSSDFIPVAASIDAILLIPNLLREDKLSKFLDKLMDVYKRSALSQLAGSDEDNTFSTLPNLQWFLRVELEDWKNGFHKRDIDLVYGDSDATMNLFYPRVCLWKDENCCIERRCRLDLLFYTLVGSPPIVVIDAHDGLTIFSEKLPITPGSELDKEIKYIVGSRFPQPKVSYTDLQNIKPLYPAPGKIQALVNARFKPKKSTSE